MILSCSLRNPSGFHVADGLLVARASVRSSVASEKEMLLERFATLCALLGASMEITGDYPAWEYKRDSALRDTMVRVFTEQYGHAPKIEAIHAGLECGLFSGKLPGLDCVSFGPDLLEIHTPREKMSIPSVQRTWKLLRGVLAYLLAGPVGEVGIWLAIPIGWALADLTGFAYYARHRAALLPPAPTAAVINLK